MALSVKKEKRKRGREKLLDFDEMNAQRAKPQGRPAATDHAAIERAAFALFENQGFDETTMEQIAQSVGVGRRTLFRYFPSKNDIPWGQFDESLRHFREELEAQPHDIPVADAVHRCVVTFNDFDEGSIAQHRVRMRLILATPDLQAHSVLRYAAWRRVIAQYVASRTGETPDAFLPRLIGHVSLALALSSYEEWLASPELRLIDVLTESTEKFRGYVCKSTGAATGAPDRIL